MQKQTYFPHIDGLRAIAIALVVIFHSGLDWLPGGFVGVDVFFVLSGFLITGQIAQQMADNRFSFSGFFLRRFRRLLPAYIVVALVTLIVGLFILLPKDLVYHSRLMGLAFLSLGNFYLNNTTEGYFARQTDEIPLLHTWSLAVEEQFYLVWPLLLLLMMRYLKGKVLVLVVALMYVAAVIFSQWHAVNYQAPAYYLLPARFFELLTGAILALVIHRLPKLSAMQAAIVALSGLVPVFYSAFFLRSGLSFPGFNALPVCLGTALLIYSGYSKNSIANVLSSAPFVALGKISYSLYLWHWPIFAFIRYVTGGVTPAQAAVAILVSIILSIASLHFVENTFRFKWKFSFRKTFIFMYVLPLLVCLVIVAVLDKGKGFPGRFGEDAIKVQALEKKATVYNEKCDRTADPLCEQIILLGDSHAAHFSSFIHVFSSQKETLKLQTIWEGFCPPLPNIYRASIDKNSGQKNYFREDNPCFRQVSAFYNSLHENKYKYVVLAGYWSIFDMKQDFLWNKENTELSINVSHKVLRTGFYDALGMLVSNNITPVIIKDNPTVTEQLLKCSFKKVLVKSYGESCEVRYEDIVKQQDYANKLFEDIARDYPQVKFIDVKKVMCDQSHCFTTLDDMPLYRDKQHLTDTGSKMLGEKYLRKFGNPLLE